MHSGYVVRSSGLYACDHCLLVCVGFVMTAGEWVPGHRGQRIILCSQLSFRAQP